MWKIGEMATAGTRLVAEAGHNGWIEREAKLKGFLGVVEGIVQYRSVSNRHTLPTVKATASQPLLSTITMVAPSPDWFTGLSDFDMRSPQSNTWYKKVVVDTYPYSSGTDAGATYNADNLPRNPYVPIFQLTPKYRPNTFLDEAGEKVLPLARWECTLLE